MLVFDENGTLDFGKLSLPMQREQRKRKLKPVMVDMAESNLSYIGGKRFPQHSDSPIES